MRQRLPNRRASKTFAFACGGMNYVATISLFDDGRLAEIFLTNRPARRRCIPAWYRTRSAHGPKGDAMTRLPQTVFVIRLEAAPGAFVSYALFSKSYFVNSACAVSRCARNNRIYSETIKQESENA